ncbi:MAG: hypothetical protein M3548_07560, partial [Actinomycetota bacterium]|nr:hypothetical protein [Actinomycetota bacterium]
MNDAPARYVTSTIEQLSNWDSQTALRHGDRTLSFTDLLAQIHRTARVLGDHGVARGDGLVMLAANPPEVQIVGLAANILGIRFT